MPRTTQDQPHAAWMSEDNRLEYNARRALCEGPKPKDETEHFYVCEGCGQAVDMRKLGDVLYHAQVEHKALLVN